MSEKEREQAWDDLFEKEVGVILEFDPGANSGRLKSIVDGSVYKIDSRQPLRTKAKLSPGDKVFFAPFEDPDGEDYARVIKKL